VAVVLLVLVLVVVLVLVLVVLVLLVLLVLVVVLVLVLVMLLVLVLVLVVVLQFSDNNRDANLAASQSSKIYNKPPRKIHISAPFLALYYSGNSKKFTELYSLDCRKKSQKSQF
jgi:hypothetical protein